MPHAQKDPGRHIALMALGDTYLHPGAMLEAVIRHAFDQLCFHRSTSELDALVADLRELLAEDA